jgi:hypothetical protein
MGLSKFLVRQIALHQEHGSWIFIPFLLQWMEVICGIENPTTGWKPTRIGILRLSVTTL